MLISRLIFSLATGILLAAIPISTVCQYNPATTKLQITDEPGVYLNMYRLSTLPPKDFADFDFLILKPLPDQEHGEIKLDRQGNALIAGRLETTDKTIYKFKRALLIFGKDRYERIEFTTAKVKNVSYKFEGSFLERSEEEGGHYTKLRGVLSKYRGGRIIARTKLGFYKWAIE